MRGAFAALLALAGLGALATGAQAAAPNGVVGRTLCLNALGAGRTDTYARIESVLGAGAVESPSDTVYQPARPHVVEQADDGLVGPHFAVLALEPGDVNLDGVPLDKGGDRSRTELKLAPSNTGVHTAFKAHEGDTYVYSWRFRIPPGMKFAPSFTHIHQIKANGGPYAEPPLITFTPLANGSMEVRHVGDRSATSATYSVLGKLPLAEIQGAWVDVREEITFSNTQGRYLLDLRDLQGKPLLHLERNGLPMWRTGADHMRPKWGIYRRHNPALNQATEDWLYLANLGITRGAMPDSACR